MTVSIDRTKVLYTGNGSTTQWDISFPFLDKDDLKVYVIDGSSSTLLLSSNYEVDESTGHLTYPLAGNDLDPLSSSQKLLIMRKTPLLQATAFDAQDNLDPDVLENGYDKAMLIAQELAEKLDRAVVFPAQTTSAQTDAQAYLNSIQTAVTTAQSAATSAQTAASTAAADTQAAINSYVDSAVGAEASARTAADALKLDITAAYSTYLTQNDASSTYLTQSGASSTYLTKSSASSTYLTKSSAASTYLAQTNAASTYLTQTNAASTYLTSSNAASTYVPLTQKATANGVASLDGNSKVPVAQLPVATLTWYTGKTGTTVTISNTSSASLVKIYKNGLLLQPTEDYTISGTTLTLTTPLVATDKITTEVL